MKTLKKLSNKVLVIGANETVALSPELHIFPHSKIENAVLLAVNITLDGYTLKMDDIDPANCEPPIVAADLAEFTEALATDFFFRVVGDNAINELQKFNYSQVADIDTWAARFEQNYVVGTLSNPTDGDIPIADLTNAFSGATTYIYHEDSVSPKFLGGIYVGLEGSVYYSNALNLIKLEYQAGRVFVSMMRVDRINVPDSLAIDGDVILNTGQEIEPNYVINLDTIQWQISDDNVTFANIVGATTQTYTTLTGQAGKYIRFQAIYVDNTEMFESQLVVSQSKLINAVVELIPSGYNMVDVAPVNGRADGIIHSHDTSGNTLYQVLSDANGFTGGFQSVTANTATPDLHFMSLRVNSSHQVDGKLKINTSYRIKIKYRATATFRVTSAAGLVFQSITNNTGGTVVGTHLDLPSTGLGSAVEVEFDVLTSATNLSNLQVQFSTNQVSPNLYQYQISIVENNA